MLAGMSECVHASPSGEQVIVNKGYSILDQMYSSGELEIFETEQIIDLIKFKWETYAKRLHMVSGLAHFAYVTILMFYVFHIYIEND